MSVSFSQFSYIFVMVESIENVIRQTAEQINDKPGFEIISANHFWITNHFSTRSNKCCVKIQYLTKLKSKFFKLNTIHRVGNFSVLPISMKNIKSTIESTTNNETSSEVLFLKATLYGTWRKTVFRKYRFIQIKKCNIP